jgi:hypothetical protein
MMIAAMARYHFIRDDEIIFDKSASRTRTTSFWKGPYMVHPVHGGERPAVNIEQREESFRLHPHLDEQALLGLATSYCGQGSAIKLMVDLRRWSYFGGSTLIVAVGPTPAVRIHIGSFPDPS